MAKEYTYKKQGDGRDSWKCTETNEKGNVVNVYMVYENPFEPLKIDLSNIDIDSLTDEQIAKLKTRFGMQWKYSTK